MYVGVAIRMAQALGLGDGDKEQLKPFRSQRSAPQPPKEPSSQVSIAKEIRRRTMFSCLILDRLLGCGKGRVSTIRAEDLQIQLPCSEIAFDLSEDVYTGFLKPTPEEAARPVNDSVLSRFVRLIDIWGEISKWSFAGGRFTEDNPPWKKESSFYQLREKLEAFYKDLPVLLQWSTSNYYKHENHQASSVYVSMHMLGAVCRIMLHREYIPFIAIRCERPVGPLDEPTFAKGEEPPEFWDISAEEIFHAARDIVDLIDICRDKLPMSALVLFSVWTAAFVGIYAVSFPHMDTKHHMLPTEEEAALESDVTKCGSTGSTFKTLSHMSGWLKMAETYVGYFRDMVDYYCKIKVVYEKHNDKKGQEPDGKLSVRLGGGGLEEWKQQGPKIVNNGEISAPEDDSHGVTRDSTMEPGSVGPDNGYQLDSNTPRSTSLSFTPINSGPHQHPQQESDPMDTRVDGLPSSAVSNWAFQQQQPPIQNSPQSSYAMPSPQMAQTPAGVPPTLTTLHFIPNLPVYGSSHELEEYMAANQSLPWSVVPGGIDQFAHGPVFEVEENGNMFWGAVTDPTPLQQVGGFT
ncbi:hypothetical protein B0H63DRAFT_465152 [Podospora didyma]|uniref:Xylanolytic transcriptional activator regulatory domain-containing protein n=1 Tax=Podospora didyma TaxID=330526 RepID=A0AAE0NZ03_9PEZI|nr:hypothetical protein B0H63DRAFT_465152 [Podospora didyma]